MRITTINYGRTLSDKDFGSFRAELTADLESGDDVQTCMDALKRVVLRNLNESLLCSKGESSTQVELPLETKEAPVAEEVVAEEPKKKVAKKTVTKKVAAKTETKKKVKKATHVAYDRNLQPHKTMFLAMASDLELRDGTTPEDKKALKETSTFMEGQEMFEAGSTDILVSFQEMAVFQFNAFKKQFQADV